MVPLTPEQRAYKEKTLNQLLANLPVLEAKLAGESSPKVADSMRDQIEEIRVHINHLQKELVANTAGEPVADELFKRAAGALTKEKFYLAKKLINKLEAIEPFYPGIERLREEAGSGRVSRRTRSIAQGTTRPVSTAALLREVATGEPLSQPIPAAGETYEIAEESQKRGISQFFQFHIIVSCSVVLLLLCVIFGVGGMTVLQWLIEGR